MSDEQCPSTPDVSAIVAWIENDIAAMEIEIRKLRARLAAKEQRLDYARSLLVGSLPTEDHGRAVEMRELQKQVLDLLRASPGRVWSSRQLSKLFQDTAFPGDVQTCIRNLCRERLVKRAKLDSGHLGFTLQARKVPPVQGPDPAPVQAPAQDEAAPSVRRPRFEDVF